MNNKVIIFITAFLIAIPKNVTCSQEQQDTPRLASFKQSTKYSLPAQSPELNDEFSLDALPVNFEQNKPTGAQSSYTPSPHVRRLRAMTHYYEQRAAALQRPQSTPPVADTPFQRRVLTPSKLQQLKDKSLDRSASQTPASCGSPSPISQDSYASTQKDPASNSFSLPNEVREVNNESSHINPAQIAAFKAHLAQLSISSPLDRGHTRFHKSHLVKRLQRSASVSLLPSQVSKITTPQSPKSPTSASVSSLPKTQTLSASPTPSIKDSKSSKSHSCSVQ